MVRKEKEGGEGAGEEWDSLGTKQQRICSQTYFEMTYHSQGRCISLKLHSFQSLEGDESILLLLSFFSIEPASYEKALS